MHTCLNRRMCHTVRGMWLSVRPWGRMVHRGTWRGRLESFNVVLPNLNDLIINLKMHLYWCFSFNNATFAHVAATNHMYGNIVRKDQIILLKRSRIGASYGKMMAWGIQQTTKEPWSAYTFSSPRSTWWARKRNAAGGFETDVTKEMSVSCRTTKPGKFVTSLNNKWLVGQQEVLCT